MWLNRLVLLAYLVAMGIALTGLSLAFVDYEINFICSEKQK